MQIYAGFGSDFDANTQEYGSKWIFMAIIDPLPCVARGAGDGRGTLRFALFLAGVCFYLKLATIIDR